MQPDQYDHITERINELVDYNATRVAALEKNGPASPQAAFYLDVIGTVAGNLIIAVTDAKEGS